ncbi:MAG: tyrosine-type recombinase/integrase, partial [Pseudomonadales bacterium]
MTKHTRKVMHRYLTEAEERQLFRHVAKYADIYARRYLAWMKLLRFTGMRINSLLHLSVAEAQAAIRTGRLEINPKHGKFGRGYSVRVSADAITQLRKLIWIRKEMGFRPEPDEALVVSRQRISREGGDAVGMSVRQYQTRVRHWAKKAGLEVIVTPHWFRHTKAMRTLAATTHAAPLQT